MLRFIRVLIFFVIMGWVSQVEAKPFGYVQTSFQAQGGGTWIPILDGSIGWAVPQTKDQLGFLAYTWVQPDWAQMYFGPTYNPSWAPWLTVGFHIGAQQDFGGSKTFLIKYATSLQVYVDKFAFLGFVEFDNKSMTGEDRLGIMYDLTAKYGIFGIIKAEPTGDNPQFTINVGLKAHRFCGIGPLVEFQVPVAYMTVWLNWAPVEPEGWQVAAVKGNKFNPSRFWTGLAVGF